MKRLLLFLACGYFLFPSHSFGDYGWIPPYQGLTGKIGYEQFSSDGNYDAGSASVPLVFQNRASKLVDHIFWLDLEYGIYDFWSVELKTRFLNSYVQSQDSGDSILSGAGLGDLYAGLKWQFKSDIPFLTLETYFKFPTAKASPDEPDELVLGDGNFDIGMIVHSGTRAGGFKFSISPGFLGRFGGYSSAFLAAGAVEYRMPRGYAQLFVDSIFSFGDPLLKDSSEDQHDSPGSGNSYSRLAGGPIGIQMGGKLGVRIIREAGLELYYAHSLTGNKYPYFSRFGVNGVINLSLYRPPEKIKVKEVPFDFDYGKFDKPEPQPESAPPTEPSTESTPEKPKEYPPE